MSSEITTKLTADLKEAMRTGDLDRRNTIRLLRSAVRNYEIETREPATDEDVVKVIEAEIKQRRDSIDAYAEAGRDDLVAKERVELDILESYLPADRRPIPEDELRQLVEQKAAELGLSGPQDMKVLMPTLIEETQGRADNRLLSKLASEELRQRADRSSD